MNTLKATLIVFVFVLTSVTAQQPPQVINIPAVAVLSTELSLRAQVQQLTEQLHNVEIGLAQCKASLDGANLTVQASELGSRHAQLDEEIKKALGGKPEDTVDWTTSPPSLKKKQP